MVPRLCDDFGLLSVNAEKAYGLNPILLISFSGGAISCLINSKMENLTEGDVAICDMFNISFLVSENLPLALSEVEGSPISPASPCSSRRASL